MNQSAARSFFEREARWQRSEERSFSPSSTPWRDCERFSIPRSQQEVADERREPHCQRSSPDIRHLSSENSETTRVPRRLLMLRTTSTSTAAIGPGQRVFLRDPPRISEAGTRGGGEAGSNPSRNEKAGRGSNLAGGYESLPRGRYRALGSHPGSEPALSLLD